MSPRTRQATSDTLRSFKFHNFRLFFGGQLISQVGNWLTLIAQSLFVLKLTTDANHPHGNGVALGFLTAFQFLPVLVLGPWAGLVADRSDKRKLLLIVQAIAMLQSFALAALALGNPPLVAVYGVAMIGGVITAFDNPARRAFVVEMVPEDHVQNAVSLNSALMTGSRVIGPAMAGLLVITVGYSWCFAIDGVSYLAVLWGLWRMVPADLRPSIPTARTKGQVMSGLRYVRATHDLWVPLVMMAVVGTLAFNFGVVMPLFVSDDFDRSTTTYTVLMSILSIGSLVGALYTARRTTVTVHNVAVGAAAFGASMLALAAVPMFYGIFPVAIAVGFASMVFMTASTAIVQVRSDPSMRGRVLALQAMVFLGSTPVGGPLLGAICEFIDPRAGLAVGGVACLGAAAWGHQRDRAVNGRALPADAARLQGSAAVGGS